ncbi:trypsin-like peptidase domain-containing protein [Streptomyces sp. NPDC048187]|uniref:nSTAND1 domain-containing NTPase n=1 Tax=Streptomyces sp. NPDC048187 TaxID=3365509 RepID=UPI003715E18A
MPRERSRSADEALNMAVVRISGKSDTIAGAGFLVTQDRVLTCAHVVSDALERDRDAEVAAGSTVLVDFPLADGVERRTFPAVVEQWVPEHPRHCGDVAILRLPDAVPGTCPLPMTDSDELSDRRVRLVGFPDGEPGVVRHRGELSGKVEGDWIQLSRADSRTVHVTRGFSGSPVWDERRGAAVGVVVAAEGKRDNTQQAFAISVKAVLARLPGVARAVTPTPFRGLDTFQESHEGIFFGRDDDVTRVVTALKGDHRAVVLCGPSGCGKSSLALAGVLPELRRQSQEEGEAFDAVVVNAGADGSLPAGLATDLYEGVRGGRFGERRADSVDQVERWLTTRGLADTLSRLRGGTGGSHVVVLDQAEALLDRTDAEIEEAVGLLSARRRPAAGTRLLVTLRSDFMDAALKHPRLGPLLTDSRTLPLAPMSREQLRDVITKPLEKAPAVAYDPGLAQRILDDACREPENLPLLGFVLKRLWDQQSAGRLRTATYEAMHGVRGALEEHCDQAWRQCVGEDAKAAASRLLRGLVRVLPGSETPLRRRLTREETGTAEWQLARSFAARRLLVLRGGQGEPETAELAHETLINVWPALREQVRGDVDFLKGRAELNHDLDRWTKEGQAAALLPGELQLAAVSSWLGNRERELTEAERDFLARARQRRRMQRARLRAAWTAAAVVLALIAGLGTFLVYQQRVSTQREAESRSRLLAGFSAEAAKQDPGQAALIALGAYEIAPTDEARNAMLRRYDEFKDASWVLSGTEGQVRSAVTSVDGAVTLVTTDNGRATLFVRRAGGRVQRLQLDADEMVHVPLVSRDGRRIAYLTATGAAVWHDLDLAAGGPEDLLGVAHTLRAAEFKRVADLTELSGQEHGLVALSPDAGRLATVSGGRLRLWDLATGRHRDVPGRPPADIETVRFGPDPNTLLVESATAAKTDVLAVDATTGAVRELATDVDASSMYGSSVGLSGDGTVLVVCRPTEHEQGDDTKVYQALRVSDGRPLNSYTYTGPNSDCESIAVDATGERFAANTFDQWAIVDTRPGGRVRHTRTRAPEKVVGRLLQDGGRPAVLVLTGSKNALTALPLVPRDVDGEDIVVSAPRLINGGKTLVARLRASAESDDEETLALVDAASGRITAEVKRSDPQPLYDPVAAEALAVNHAETLVADVVDDDRILVRRLPSLREVAEITTLEPPVDRNGRAEPLTLLFLPGGDELVTLSGSRIEHFDARTGSRLTPPIDARTLGLSRRNPPAYGSTEGAGDSGFAVNSRPEPGHIQVMIYGDPVLHAVDLRTGKEDKDLRITLGESVERAFLDRGGRYAAAKTPGGMLELWSAEHGHDPARLVGPLGPLGANRAFTGEGFSFSFTGDDGEFYVANGSSVRFQQLSDPSRFETYDFETDQSFLAATEDGRTLLRARSEESSFGNDGRGRLDLLRLDPGLWKRHLCTALGRDLAEDERRGMPAGLPEEIC